MTNKAIKKQQKKVQTYPLIGAGKVAHLSKQMQSQLHSSPNSLAHHQTPTNLEKKPLTLRETKPDRFLSLNQSEVVFDQEVFDKIMFWVDRSPVEVSGFGRVIIKDGNFTVISAYLLDQENSGASTDIAPEAMAKLMYESREDEGHLNFWWHSHVNMAVYWSGTDTETIKQIGEQGWCLATVFNKKDESRSAYYQKGDDFMPEIFMDDLESATEYISDNKQAEWEEEYSKKCKAKKYIQSTGTVGNVGDDVNMTSAELAEWWEEYNNRNDIIDRCGLATNLKVADLTRAETIDLFDAFLDVKGSEPLSVLDLNAFYSIDLKGDINEVYYTNVN